MHRLQEAVRSIEETSRKIVETAKGLPEQLLVWKPAENVWSIMEILCHVDETLSYWPVEFERVVNQPGIEWGRGMQDEARLAAVRLASGRSFDEVLRGIEERTRRAGEIFGRLHDEDLAIESPSRNPRFGIKPMSFIVDHMLVEHLEKHLRQIQRNVTQFSAAEPVT